MGVFDVACVESGLVIDGRLQLIPIVATRSRPREDSQIELAMMPWEPLSLPIAGSYNSYGTIEVRPVLELSS